KLEEAEREALERAYPCEVRADEVLASSEIQKTRHKLVARIENECERARSFFIHELRFHNNSNYYFSRHEMLNLYGSVSHSLVAKMLRPIHDFCLVINFAF